MSFFDVDTSQPYTNYCTPQEVLNFLRLPLDPDLVSAVQTHILRAEAYIDGVARTCFGGKACISDLEYYSLTKWLGGYWLGAGIPIHLTKRPVVKILRFELFNGSSWENVLNYPEGRVTGYWWCDYQDGICYIQTLLFPMGGREVRIQYQFGYSYVPPLVRQAAILLASKYFLLFERHRLSLVDTDQSIDFSGMVESISRELEGLMRLISGASIVGGEVIG